MPGRIPLYAKILSWSLLNLLLLALAGWLVLQQQLSFGLDSLLAGRAGDRVRALARHAIREMENSRPEEWNDILRRFESAYPLSIAVYNRGGTQVAGDPLELPAEVKTRLIHWPPRGGPIGVPGGRPFRNPSRPEPDDAPGAKKEPPGPPFELRNPPRPYGPPDAPLELGSVIRAGDPARYWILLRTRIHSARGEGRDTPLALVLCSETLSAGGLVLDLVPLAWAAGGVLFFSLLLWAPLVAGITRSIGKMRKATNEIAAGRFDVRLNEKRRDELGDLANSINTMTERLSGLVQGQKRFLGDVAHELCAPLSRLQMALGILESRQADSEQVRDVREETDQIANLVNELLSFSKAALGSHHITLAAVNVRKLIDAVMQRESVKGATIEVDCSGEFEVLGDQPLLERALGNLVRNSIRYAADAGIIKVSATQERDEVTIKVTDRGPGVPQEDLPKLFDPFFRVDTSRTRETGGVGLGLTIAKNCIEACQGRITARNAPEGGLEVILWLRSAVHGNKLAQP